MKTYLTLQEAAEEARICKSTLMRIRARGEGPQEIRLGGRVLIPRFALDEWLMAMMTQPVRPLQES